MPVTTAADLFQALRDLGLLSEAELAPFDAEFEGDRGDARLAARRLVERGRLTPFQANQVVQGEPGNLAVGDFLLLDHLGEGGMGHVYKARRKHDPNPVALKVIRPERLENADAIRRFGREAKAASLLEHDGLVRVLEIGETQGLHFFVMEYVDGVDLQRLVMKQGRLAIPQACEYVQQAARTLHHVHRHGLVHRDVKPANLMVSADGKTVKVLDLGLARVEPTGASATAPSQLTREGVVMGTPDFLAPEQALDPHGADSRADIYSLGCTLYYLLAGQPPFPGGTLAQKLLWHQQAEPPRLESVRPDAPAALGAVLRIMMAKRPNERQQTAEQVSRLLASFATPHCAGDAAPVVAAVVEQGPRRPPVLVVSAEVLASNGPISVLPAGTLMDGPAPPIRPADERTLLAAPFAAPPRTAEPTSRRGTLRWAVYAGGGALLVLACGLVAWMLMGGGDASPQTDPKTISPTKVEVKLPAPVADAVLGAEGRYLILHLPKPRQLAVLDLREARVVKFLQLPDGNALVAAGKDMVIAVLPDRGLVQRWSLTTFEREANTTLPIGSIRGMAMGSHSDGPLLLGARNSSVMFVDPKTLNQLAIPVTNMSRTNEDGVCVRASADGTVFALWSPDSPRKRSINVRDGRAACYWLHSALGHVIPSPDGRFLYTAGRGPFTSDGRPCRRDATNNNNPQFDFCVPAVQGDYYLAAVWRERAWDQPGVLTVHAVGNDSPVLRLTDVEMPPPPRYGYGDVEAFASDRRIHFVPSAKALVTIPANEDRVVLHRFDLMEALEKSGSGYLMVTSQPVVAATPGEPYSYPIAVSSSRGGLKYLLVVRPEGMTISPAGVLQWKPPADFANAEADVIVKISDSAGHETFHTFRIQVRARPAAPAAKVNVPEPPAVAQPLPRPRGLPVIQPPQLDADRVVCDLPAPAEDLVAGGGGRYLILHLPKLRELAVFDVNAGKIVKQLPLASNAVKIAAGADKLVVVYCDTRAIERWSLDTFERESKGTLSVKGVVKNICMGAGSNGPLVVRSGVSAPNANRAYYSLVDVQTLDSRDALPPPQQGFGTGARIDDVTHIRASADGKTFGVWQTSGSEMGVFRLSGQLLQPRHEHKSVGHVAPGPDGTTIYTGEGRFDEVVRPQEDWSRQFYVPAHHAAFYLGVDAETGRVAIHIAGNSRLLLKPADITFTAEYEARVKHDLTNDKRIHYIPQANLLITMPKTSDRLILHRVNLEQALEKQEIDYLFVASEPPASVRRGGDYAYDMDVKARKGGATCRLVSGPGGMTVSPGGRIRWAVPQNFASLAEPVTVSVRDGPGQEVFHTFTIAVER